jgi:erythronate-4-phosphate dehydrogenase
VELPESTLINLYGTGRDEESVIAEAVLKTYDIEADDRALRNSPPLFEKLRGDYPVRREFTSYSVNGRNMPGESLSRLREMGFSIIR